MSWYWAAYLLIGFGVPETIGLVSGHPAWTLSETVWRWCDVAPGNTLGHWSAVHIFLAMFMLWLTAHLVIGIWR